MVTAYTTRMILLCALTASLAACNSAPPAAPAAPPVAPSVDTGKIADAVRTDLAQLMTELNARDLDKAVGHDSADMVGMFHGMPNVVGPAADKAMTEQMLKDPAFHLAVSGETVDVAAAGDMAVYRATYSHSDRPEVEEAGRRKRQLARGLQAGGRCVEDRVERGVRHRPRTGRGEVGLPAGG